MDNTILEAEVPVSEGGVEQRSEALGCPSVPTVPSADIGSVGTCLGLGMHVGGFCGAGGGDSEGEGEGADTST